MNMNRFKKVYVEITNVCNLKCRFCPITCRDPKFMDTDEFMQIVNQVKKYSDYIYLHVKGEPLLHPKLDEILQISYENKLKVNITTNGTLIHKVRDILLSAPALRQINISLHSLEQNSENNQEEVYMNRILEFAKDLRKTNVILSFRLWNLNELSEENLDKNRYILNRLKDEFNLDNEIFQEHKHGLKIRDRLYLNHDIEFLWPDLKNDIYEEHRFCYGLRDQIGILADGTVIPCCLDGEGVINLGNVFHDNLENILSSERALSIYRNFSNRTAIEELCKRCGYRIR